MSANVTPESTLEAYPRPAHRFQDLRMDDNPLFYWWAARVSIPAPWD